RTISLNSAALPAITNPLTVTGLGQNALTVSGNGVFRVFDVAAGVVAGITDLTITRGAVAAGGDGAGIRNAGALAVQRVTASQGAAGGAGGGIENAAGATLTLTDSNVTGNRASGAITFGAGGGLDNFGAAVVTTSSVSDNTTDVDHGGGIENRAGATLTLVGSTVFANVSGNGGGGIRNVSASASALVI